MTSSAAVSSSAVSSSAATSSDAADSGTTTGEVDAVDLEIGSGQYDTGTAKMDGERYPKSIMYTQWAAYDGGTARFDLSRKCSRLHVTMGFADDAQDGATADMYIKGDGQSLWQRSYEFGDRPEAVDIDVTGILRLEIGGTYDMKGHGAGGPVAGSPKVTCAGIIVPTT